jgi:hypothetical protein
MKLSIDFYKDSKPLHIHPMHGQLYGAKIKQEDYDVVKDDISKLDDDAFRDKYKLHKKNIILHGEFDIPTSNEVDFLIPKVETKYNLLGIDTGDKGYKCFSSPERCVHDSKESSVYCLRAYLNNPEYLIIHNDIRLVQKGY